jgi:hypothetical protein
MYPNIFLCEVSLNLFSGKIIIPQARAFLFLATRIQGKKRDFFSEKKLDLSKGCLRRPLRS